MPTVAQLMEWTRSGEGRLIAAVVLYILMWTLKSRIPIVNKWLQADGPKLTSKKKKLLAKVVLAMSPVAVVLTDTSQSAWEAIVMAVGIATSAGGIQSWSKALTHKPKPSAAAPDEADDDEAEGQDDDDSEKAETGKTDADETRRTTPATGDEG